MASDNDSSCVCDPNFAIICSFLEKFGKICGITYPDFNELQEMIENTQEVPEALNELHVKLLRKAKRSVHNDRWEKALVKFCHSYSNQDAWEIERFGYKKSRISVKLRVLKTLLEAQFDMNPKFKTEVNKMPTEELRLEPIGKDKKGFSYWYQVDEFCNVRVYREDPDEETWDLIAKDRAGIVSIISQLSSNNSDTIESVTNEDSNSLEIEKPITDTGQVDLPVEEDCKDPSINSQDSEETTSKFTVKQTITKDEEASTPNESISPSPTETKTQSISPISNSNVNQDLPENKDNEESTTESNESSKLENTDLKISTPDTASTELNVSKENSEEKSDETPKVDSEKLDSVKKEENESDMSEENTHKRGIDDVDTTENESKKPKAENVEVSDEKTEDTMIITGEGTGAECDSANDYIVEDEIVEDVVYFYGEGSGHECFAANNEKDKDDSENVKVTSQNKSGSDSNEKIDCNSTLLNTPPDAETSTTNKETSEIENKSDIAAVSSPKREENFNSDGNSNCKPNAPLPVTKRFLLSAKESRKEDEVDVSTENNEKCDQVITNSSKDATAESKSMFFFGPGSLKKKLDSLVTDSDDAKPENNLDSSEISKDCTSKLDETQEISNKTSDEKDCTTKLDETQENIVSDENDKEIIQGSSELNIDNISKINIDINEAPTDQTDKLSDNSEQLESSTDSKVSTISPKSPKSTEAEAEINCNNEVPNADTKLDVNSTKNELKDEVTTQDSKTKEVSTISETSLSDENSKNELGKSTALVDDDSTVSNLPEKTISSNIEESENSKHADDTKNIDKCNDETVSPENKNDETKLNDLSFDSKDKIDEKKSNKIKENTVIVTRKSSKRLKKQLDAKAAVDPLMMSEENDSLNSGKPLLMCVDINKLKAKPDISKKIIPSINKDLGKKRAVNSKIPTDPIGTIDTDNLDMQDNADEDPLSGVDLDLQKTPEISEIDNADVLSHKSKTRKREREQDTDENSEQESKRLRSRNRHIDSELRKSIEQKKLEMDDGSSSSSDDDKMVSERMSLKIPINDGPTPRRQVARRGGVRPVQTRSAATTPSTPVSKTQPKNFKGRTIVKPVRNMELIFPEITETKKKPKKLLGLEIDESMSEDKITPIRQSRRIAQIKIKEEAERRKIEELTLEDMKSQSKSQKDADKKKKKGKNYTEDEDYSNSDEEFMETNKKKSKKKKKGLKFDESNPWKSSSGSSSSDDEEDVEPEMEEEVSDDEVLAFKSDHEFSPESDIEENEEVQPLRRARTAKVESDVEEIDDYACQKCGKSDHPEWILLCDSCDFGWHCSCLRPALLVIPEGDWFCPPCQHITLISRLKLKLEEFDKQEKKIENEILHRQRLQYVGISMANVLPIKELDKSKIKSKLDDEDITMEYENGGDSAGSDIESSRSGSGSSGESSSEPIYQLRQRRQANSYRFNEYDDLINSAIQDELEAVKGAGNQGRGKDINTIVNAEKEELEKQKQEECEDDDKKEQSPLSGDENDRTIDNDSQSIVDEIPPVVKKKTGGKKKHAKLTSLDVDSDDDDANSDEDFKGSSSEEDFEEESGTEESGSSFGRGRRSTAVRRSSRRRATRYDNDFINDDSDDDIPKSKKSRSIWDESESEESDGSWGNKKKRSRKTRNPSPKPKKVFWKPKKKKNRITSDNESDLEKRVKKPKIKYGGLTDEDENISSLPRTRGKKINYLEALGSDSEEDQHKSTVKPLRESEDEFVLNDEEEEDEDDEEAIKNDVSMNEESVVTCKVSEKVITETKENDLKDTPSKLIEANSESGQNISVPKNEDASNKTVPSVVQNEHAKANLGGVTTRGTTKSTRGVRGARGGRGATRDTPSSRGTPSARGRGRGRGRPRGSTLTSPGSFQDRMSSLQTSHDSKKSDSSFKSDFKKFATSMSDEEEEEDESDDSELDESETDESLEEGEIPQSRFGIDGLDSDELENMDEEELAELMMEEEEFANKQLELMGSKIAKEKKAKESKENQEEKQKHSQESPEKEPPHPKVIDEIQKSIPQETSKDNPGVGQKVSRKKKKDTDNDTKLSLTPTPSPSNIMNILPNNPCNSINMTSPVGLLQSNNSQSSMSNTNSEIMPHFNESNSSFKSEESKTSDGFPQTTAIRNILMQHSSDMNSEIPDSFSTDIKMDQPTPPKRRGRGKGKKTLAAEAAAAAAKASELGPAIGSDGSTKGIPTPATTINSKLGIAPPPQPFLQAQPTPSVITRMLQSAPVGPTQNFNPLPNSMGPRFFNSSVPPSEGLPPRGSVLFAGRAVPNMYRPPAPTPPGSQVMPVTGNGGPVFHSAHHPLDPSPSGGGTITVTAPSPVDKNPSMILPPAGGNLLNPIRMTMPPPVPPPGTGPPPIRHHLPPFAVGSQPNVPPRPPGNFSPYPPQPPTNYPFGTYPPPPLLAPSEDALPAYQDPPYPEHYIPPPEAEAVPQPVLENSNSKPFEEETGGEFGGLVSYFSSQREDDIDS